MKKLFIKIFTCFFFLLIFTFAGNPSIVNAIEFCSGINIGATLNNRPLISVYEEETSIKITVRGLQVNENYRIKVQRDSFGDLSGWFCDDYLIDATSDGEGQAIFSLNERDHPGAFLKSGWCQSTNEVHLRNKDNQFICQLGKYTVFDPGTVLNCQATVEPPYPDIKDDFAFHISGFEHYTDTYFKAFCAGSSGVYGNSLGKPDASGTFTPLITSSNKLPAGEYRCIVERSIAIAYAARNYCQFNFTIFENNDDPNTPPEAVVEEVQIFRPETCGEDRDGDGEPDDIQTALGCFPTEPKAIIEWVLKYSIMFAGGIGFLIMLFAAFQIMTSGGDPEKLQAGKELLVSAIIGMLLIIFSLFLLRFIGWNILRIPGWEAGT